jgi:hypothetical protein
MGTIHFQCPMTGSAVSTGVETEPISFCRLSKTWLEVYCPLCERFHDAKIWLAQENVGFHELQQERCHSDARRSSVILRKWR